MEDQITYVCKRCNETVKNIHRNNHDLYCAYVPKESEFIDLIPCEICDNFIKFNEYEEHIKNCGRRYTPRNGIINRLLNTPSLINNINSIITNRTEQINDVDSSPSNIPPHSSPPYSPPPPPLEVENYEEVNDTDAIIYTIENENTAQPNTFPFLNRTLINASYYQNSDINISPIENSETSESTGNIIIRPSIQNYINMPSSYELFENITYRGRTNTQNLTQSITQTLDSIIENVTQNINNYENFGNLEDVTVGIDDIDKVAPIIKTEEETLCPICFKNFYIIRKTKCNHEFCKDCIETWLNESKKCPICMRYLDEINKEDNSSSDDTQSIIESLRIPSISDSFNSTNDSYQHINDSLSDLLNIPIITPEMRSNSETSDSQESLIPFIPPNNNEQNIINVLIEQNFYNSDNDSDNDSEVLENLSVPIIKSTEV